MKLSALPVNFSQPCFVVSRSFDNDAIDARKPDVTHGCD
jgi:hypothetical protein